MPSTDRDTARLDRPSESIDNNRLQQTPWSVTDQRGALYLGRDGAQHRRFHGLFEDMLN
ncbi:hypothetical protein [Palleronia pelagia]|uniref:Uncharacterized protein n=1 Tax=Palleronia pelagia TaxID=387096 RepID=A0A1H8AZG3_9RHOB|nr:hypothetical protein [Palleronia pelagia]SEM75304.1 hypothetical protein SAMN04488011_101348 [Palleronia pelagia]